MLYFRLVFYFFIFSFVLHGFDSGSPLLPPVRLSANLRNQTYSLLVVILCFELRRFSGHATITLAKRFQDENIFE